MLLEETRAVLSLGKLCEDHGYNFHWTSGQKPHLTQNDRKINCNTANFVPFVVPGLSTSSSTSSSPASSTSSSKDSEVSAENPERSEIMRSKMAERSNAKRRTTYHSLSLVYRLFKLIFTCFSYIFIAGHRSTPLEWQRTRIRLHLLPTHVPVALGSHCSFEKMLAYALESSTFSPSAYMSSTAFSKTLTRSAMGCPDRLWSILQKNSWTYPFFVASFIPITLSSNFSRNFTPATIPSLVSLFSPVRMHGPGHEAHCLRFAQKHSYLIAQCRTSRHT